MSFVAVTAFDCTTWALATDGSVWMNDNFYVGQDECPSIWDSGRWAHSMHHSLYLGGDGSIAVMQPCQLGGSSSDKCVAARVPLPNAGFVAVAAGSLHSLGLKADGSVVAWGCNFDGQCDVPAPNTDFVAIVAGAWHNLGLKRDGSIVAWGSNYDEYGRYLGQCAVPAPNTNFVAIAAGWYHSLGLKADGTIVAWGSDRYGQCDVPWPTTGFVAVAAGFLHSVGLKAFYGDLNCDGLINCDDIAPFALAITDPASYAAQFPHCHILNADCNGDGAVTFDDIDAFIAVLSAS
jgi:hypothetical protein